MGTMLYNISQILGITVIHSLWQALLIYFLLRIALTFGDKLSSAIKYHLALTSLLAITGWFVYTLVTEINVYNWLAVKTLKISDLPAMLNLPAGVHQFNDQTIRYYYDIEGYLPYIATVYIAGLAFNTVKLVLARKKITAIKHTMSVDIGLQHQVNKLMKALNIITDVRIGLSKLVDVPCMVGCLKPVILLPFTVTNYLSAEEIEAILLHELAHIKRNDYLVNMIQQIISILLFFNPCTLLINRIINEERENCCDDLVVKATADPIIYAKALLKLEQNRQNDWKLALAAIGKKYHLLNRIERIMKTKKQLPSLRPALLATLILTIGIGCMALLKPEVAEGKISIKNISPVINAMLADTGHKSKPAAHVKQAHHAAMHKSTATFSEAENDRKIEELSAEVQKYSDVINKHYNDPEFKKLERQIEELGNKLEESYQSPAVKHQQEELAKLGEDFSKKWTESDKMKSLESKLGEMGRDMGVYFSSPEFKRLDAEVRKKYGIPADRKYFDDNKDENYRKYQDELTSRLPPKIKAETEDMKQMGEEIGRPYESDEYKAESKRLQELGDSVGKVYQNPGMLKTQEEIEKLSAKMTAWQNMPDVKMAQEELTRAVSKLNAYMNSPAYKNYIKALQNLNFNYNFNLNDNNEKPEKAEKPEKPEKPEAPEKPETPGGDDQ